LLGLSNCYSELDELKGELTRVVCERDKLANDMKNDAVRLNDRIAAATKQGCMFIPDYCERRLKSRILLCHFVQLLSAFTASCV